MWWKYALCLFTGIVLRELFEFYKRTVINKPEPQDVKSEHLTYGVLQKRMTEIKLMLRELNVHDDYELFSNLMDEAKRITRQIIELSSQLQRSTIGGGNYYHPLNPFLSLWHWFKCLLTKPSN